MSALLSIAWRSAWNRRFALALTVLSMALATLLLLGVERLRTQLRDNFSSSVSGTDLIVGARAGSAQLMLSSIFRIGAPTDDISWKSVQALAAHPGVDWVIPLSLGDSHRGFAVLATTPAYFTHFRFGDRQALALRDGRLSEAQFDAVVGADVAARLGYRVGQRIVLSRNGDRPFTVVGVLARTGTPVDRTVHIGLEAGEALHLDWLADDPASGMRTATEQMRGFDLAPRRATAVLVGVKSRNAMFGVQRWAEAYADEPLMAVSPGAALDELWRVVDVGGKALLAMAALVALASLAGLVSVAIAGLNSRRREFAVLRSVGAGLGDVMTLVALEGALVTLLGVALGAVAATAGIVVLSPWLQTKFGVGLALSAPTVNEALLAAALLGAGWLASLVPGLRACRLAQADGLCPRT